MNQLSAPNDLCGNSDIVMELGVAVFVIPTAGADISDIVTENPFSKIHRRDSQRDGIWFIKSTALG
jgi:hypothetical protein